MKRQCLVWLAIALLTGCELHGRAKLLLTCEVICDQCTNLRITCARDAAEPVLISSKALPAQ